MFYRTHTRTKQAELDRMAVEHQEQLTQLTDGLERARREIETLRRQEEEAALAAAETKQKVHEELLRQEADVLRLRSEREHLNTKGTWMRLRWPLSIYCICNFT